MSQLSSNDTDTTRPTQSRRRFLIEVGAATAALAGCASNGDEDDDPAEDETESFDPASDLSYGAWLTTAEDGMMFAHADLEAARMNNESDAEAGGLPEDPLLAYPLVMTQTTVGIGQISLSFAGLTPAISPDTSSDSTVREVTVVNQTIVAEGTFATDKLERRLTEPADATYGIVYEQTTTTGGYDQYEPTEVPDAVNDPPAVALGEETVLVSPGVEQLQRMAAAGTGEQSRIYETDETVAQLLEQAGSGDLVFGKLGSLSDGGFDPRERFESDPQFDPQSGEDVVASITFEDNNAVESRFALAADEFGENRRETFETAFGTAAVGDSVSVDVSDSMVIASGTYDAETWLTNPGGSGDDGLSQAAAAELLPPEALGYQYEPVPGQQFDEFWVTVAEETDAAGLRLEAASGGSTEFRPQDRPVGPDDSVAVQVDPDGDSVTVSVINDEGAVGELTAQSVPTDDLSEMAANQAVPDDALSFSYEAPGSSEFGSLTVEVVTDTDAQTLVAQPQEAPGLFTDRVGSLTGGETVDAGTTLETAVDPGGDEVIVYASVDGATGEVARWQGPE
jgi:hypothetical protein